MKPTSVKGCSRCQKTSAFAGNGQSLAWIIRGSTDGARTIFGMQRQRNWDPSIAVSAYSRGCFAANATKSGK